MKTVVFSQGFKHQLVDLTMTLAWLIFIVSAQTLEWLITQG